MPWVAQQTGLWAEIALTGSPAETKLDNTLKPRTHRKAFFDCDPSLLLVPSLELSYSIDTLHQLLARKPFLVTHLPHWVCGGCMSHCAAYYRPLRSFENAQDERLLEVLQRRFETLWLVQGFGLSKMTFPLDWFDE